MNTPTVIDKERLRWKGKTHISRTDWFQKSKYFHTIKKHLLTGKVINANYNVILITYVMIEVLFLSTKLK